MVAYRHMSMEKKVMTKKGHQIFGQEKCTPREILATPMTTAGFMTQVVCVADCLETAVSSEPHT